MQTSTRAHTIKQLATTWQLTNLQAGLCDLLQNLYTQAIFHYES